tara:strand:+ start:5540 stop:6268 length:729 start_codon:yes stop_codon:yes gene_type:complete
MRLDYMTVTGADDNTNIQGMIELSKDYPFLEWGILFPTMGGSRFPSLSWLHKLTSTLEKDKHNLNLSAHLCGDDLLDALDNNLKINLKKFSRIQLNFHGASEYSSDRYLLKNTVKDFVRKQEDYNRKVIFQLDGVNDRVISEQFNAVKFPNVQYLFDTSSGAGILPTTFPMPYPKITCGFAGGLGPESINKTLFTFKEVLSPTKRFWIDMETQVRTEGELDLNKVAQCAASVSEVTYGSLPI